MFGMDNLLDPMQRTAAIPAYLAAPPPPPRDASERPDPNATEHTVDEHVPYVPSDSQRREIAQKLLVEALKDDTSASTHELRDGCVRVRKSGLVGVYCCDLGECGDTKCGCFRLKLPSGRRRFRQLVAQRVDEDLRAAADAQRILHDTNSSTGSAAPGVRAVTIGSGGLLTDFEILLDLWSRGQRIESLVAIDTAYDQKANRESRALAAMAIFFAPARVFSFGSSEDFLAAVAASPGLYGEANVVVYCDAAAVPHDTWTKIACAALLPGYRAFELANSHPSVGCQLSPLNSYLPPRLQHRHTATGGSTMRCVRLKPNSTASLDDGDIKENGQPPRPLRLRQVRPAGGELEDVLDPLIRHEERAQPHSLRLEAIAELKANAMERAEAHGKRMFRVVFDGTPAQKKAGQPGRMPVRSAPSRDALIAGARTKGDEIIVDVVKDDGWVRLSPLDTYAGYEMLPQAPEHDSNAKKANSTHKEMWMLIRADDVGELLEEIVLDGKGKEVNDAWMPSLT